MKEISDEIYLDQASEENRQTYKNSPYYEIEESLLCLAPSPEDLIIGEIDDQEETEHRERLMEIAHLALSKLTDVQRRRYLMYHVEDKTVREIADIEGAHFTTIHESLKSAEKKINKFLSEA